MTTRLPIEEKILNAYNLPAPRAAFLSELSRSVNQPLPKPKRAFSPGKRFAWAGLSLILLLVLILAVLGPKNVLAQLQNWLGILPGIGLIESDTPIRTLKEPVSLTRDGITLTVTDGVLTPETTLINIRLQGIPASAYPKDENIPGCGEAQYLLTPDGVRIDALGHNEYFPVPAEVNRLTLVFPCLMNTLAGTVPTDWRVPLEFIPGEAPLALTPVFVIETPAPLEETDPIQTQAGNALTITHALADDGDLILGGYIEGLQESTQFWTKTFEVTDSKGNLVPFNQEVESSIADILASKPGFWTLAADPSGISFPIEIKTSFFELSQPLTEEEALFSLALPDDYLVLDLPVEKTFRIAGEEVALYSVRGQPSQFGGYIYNFFFREHPVIKRISVQMADGRVNAPSEGGTGPSVMFGEPVFMADLYVPEGPLHGEQNFRFFAPVKALERVEISQSFAPDAALAELLASQQNDEPPCLGYTSLQIPGEFEAALPDGKIMIRQVVSPARWGSALYDLATGERILQPPEGNDWFWTSFSPDGNALAFFDQDGRLMTIDLTTQETRQLSAVKGYNALWSPDGLWIAFVQNTAEDLGPMLVSPDGKELITIPLRGSSSIVGWSADSQRLFFKLHSSSGMGSTLYAYDLKSRSAEKSDLAGEDSSLSGNFVLSPDEKFALIARGSLKWVLRNLQTGEEKLLVRGIRLLEPKWANSDWILFNVQDRGNTFAPILLNPHTCQAVRLPEAMQGDADSIWLAP